MNVCVIIVRKENKGKFACLFHSFLLRAPFRKHPNRREGITDQSWVNH